MVDDADPALPETAPGITPGAIQRAGARTDPLAGPRDARLVRDLLRRARHGALATRERDTGAPYASLATVGTCADGAPLVLISRLALHTLNLEADPRASLLVAEVGAGDPLAHPRASLSLRAARCEDPAEQERFLRRHPGARGYAGFADFSFQRLEPLGAHLVAGFGRIRDVPGAALLAPAPALAAIEAEALDHLNADHADALALYAAGALGRPAGDGWRAVGLDAEGLDLAREDEGDEAHARAPFPTPATTPGALRATLAAMARAARAGAA